MGCICPTCKRPMLQRKRIICPECGKEVSITPAGNYNTHNHPDSYGRHRNRCKMSRQQVEPNFIGGGI